MRLTRVLEACLYIDDLSTAEAFYSNALALTFVSRQEGRRLFYRCGPSMVLLFIAESSRAADSDVPPHGAVGPGHLALAAEAEQMDEWRRRLESHGVVIEREINWPQGGRSLYFRDPAGNSLEIATPSIWEFTPADA